MKDHHILEEIQRARSYFGIYLAQATNVDPEILLAQPFSHLTEQAEEIFEAEMRDGSIAAIELDRISGAFSIRSRWVNIGAFKKDRGQTVLRLLRLART